MTTEFPIEKREVTHFVVVDIEATGQNCLKHWMPEFAASFWCVGDRAPLDVKYWALKQPEGTEWCELALRELWNADAHKKDGETLLDRYKKRCLVHEPKEPSDAMHQFVEWCYQIESTMESDETVVLLSDTNGFDLTFLNVYLARYASDVAESVTYVFGEYRPAFHVDSYYLGLGKTFCCWGTEKAALNRLKLKFPQWVLDYEHTHDPADDCCSIGAKASFLINTTH